MKTEGSVGRWFRWAAGAAALVGAITGAVLPNLGQATSHLFDIKLTPPSGNECEEPRLNQAWHGTGNRALDWDNTLLPGGAENRTVFLRGFFGLTGGPQATGLLRASPAFVSGGQFDCDIVKVEIREELLVGTPTPLQADPRYVHTFLNPPIATGEDRDFVIKTPSSPPEAFVNKPFARMGGSDDGCGWTGTHVHETHVPAAASHDTNDARYSGQAGNEFFNDDINNWTREFQWTADQFGP